MYFSSKQLTFHRASVLAGSLVLGLIGCGGEGTEPNEAVVVTDPNASVATATPSATPSAPSDSGAAAKAPAGEAAAGTPEVKAEGWGTLKGTITFNGTAPNVTELVKKGQAPKDTDFCAKDEPIKSERLIVDAGSKGVKNVLVYLSKPTAVKPEAKDAAAKAEVIFDQEKCVFEPHVIALMNGAKVVLKNSDPVNHNVNSKLKNNGTNPNVAPNTEQPFQTQGAERTPGEVVCDIHNWMKAYWMVLDNPYFAVTDAQGNFEIKDVPAGTQKVVVWQEATTGGFVTAASGQAVNIKADDTTQFDLKIEAGKIRKE